MPAYEVTAPDGRTFEVTAPDGASQDEVIAYAKANMPPANTEKYNPMQAALIATGKNLTRLGQGAQQLYYGMRGDEDKLNALKAQVDEENRLYRPLEESHPVATAIGEALPSVAGGPLTMAALGALEYGDAGDRALRAGAGFVGGKAGELVGKAVGRAANPVRQAFERFDIPSLPSQVMDSTPMRWLESTVAQLPGGGRVRAMQEAQREALNSAAMKVAGATDNIVTPESAEAARMAAGAKIGGDTSSVPVVDIASNNYQLLRELDAVKSRYGNKLDTLQKPVIQNLLDDIEKQGNSMSGEFYQNTRSDIQAMAQGAQGSYKNALTGIYKALDRAFDRSAPKEIADAVKQSRSEYRAAKSLEKIATPEGNVSPVRLANAYAKIPGEARDLSQVAANMRQMPMSGSAERLFYQGLLSSGIGAGGAFYEGDPTAALKYGAGAFAAPWLAAQLLTRPTLQKAFTRGLLEVSPEAEKLLSRGGAGVGGLLGLSLAP